MLDVLYLLSDRENWERYHQFIKDNILSDEARVIVKDIAEYYSQFPNCEHIDWRSFSTWFGAVRHPVFKQEKQDMFKQIFKRLDSYEPDEELQEKLIQNFIARDYATRIYLVSQDVAEGEKDSDSLNQINNLMESYENEIGKTEDNQHILTWDNGIFDAVSGKGYEWRLDFLNQSLGHLTAPSFIIIGARPDAGKTSMLASEATYMAQQMEPDDCVLWINNEEDGHKVQYRIIQAALGWDDQQMKASPLTAMEEYEKIMGRMDKIKFMDRGFITTRMVEKALEQYQPKLLIIDQLRKVHGASTNDNEVVKLGQVFNQAREWGKDYKCPIINVHQAGAEGEGVKYMTMDMLYGGKTDIQGEADAIIMIGRSHDGATGPDTRFINIPKNKLPGVDRSLRNGKAEVVIVPEIARFKE